MCPDRHKEGELLDSSLEVEEVTAGKRAGDQQTGQDMKRRRVGEKIDSNSDDDVEVEVMEHSEEYERIIEISSDEEEGEEEGNKVSEAPENTSEDDDSQAGLLDSSGDTVEEGYSGGCSDEPDGKDEDHEKLLATGDLLKASETLVRELERKMLKEVQEAGKEAKQMLSLVEAEGKAREQLGDEVTKLREELERKTKAMQEEVEKAKQEGIDMAKNDVTQLREKLEKEVMNAQQKMVKAMQLEIDLVKKADTEVIKLRKEVKGWKREAVKAKQKAEGAKQEAEGANGRLAEALERGASLATELARLQAENAELKAALVGKTTEVQSLQLASREQEGRGEGEQEGDGVEQADPGTLSLPLPLPTHSSPYSPHHSTYSFTCSPSSPQSLEVDLPRLEELAERAIKFAVRDEVAQQLEPFRRAPSSTSPSAACSRRGPGRSTTRRTSPRPAAPCRWRCGRR